MRPDRWAGHVVGSIALLLACGVSAASAIGEGESGAGAEVLFVARVGPMLEARCLPCHGDDPGSIRGGLDLRSRSAMLLGGDSGEPGLVEGSPEESLLYLAVSRDDPLLAMPPKANDALSAEEVEAFRAWIAGGAPWPSADRAAELRQEAEASNAAGGVRVATSGGQSVEWTDRRYDPADLWAYRPLHRPEIPEASRASSNPIDAFLDAKLDDLGLEGAPMADRRTLIRRATFDLLGLPPTPAEIDAFEADPRPDAQAFDRVVDRLLASPHYGEQWGRHWLDVVRYADSAGFANDYERGNAWRYRDYVVRAFNDDIPYDEFVREQIAGDELDPEDPESRIATGMLRMGPWELTGMEVAKVARQRYLDDVTDTVGQVFLAQPLQCARCHDHKFDPIPTRDYYAFQAVFATTQQAERATPFLASENLGGFDEVRDLESRRGRYRAILDRINTKEEAAARAWSAAHDLPYIPRAEGLKQGVPEDQLPPKQIGLEPEDLGLERIARKGLERLAWEFERYEPFATAVYSGRTPDLKSVNAPQRVPEGRLERGDREMTRILAGGDPFADGEAVAPGVLSVVAGLAESSGEAPPERIPEGIEGRRAALAGWIGDPNNPLPPRVMVNRIWQGHFGRGIAGNPNNFGATGKRPSHPQLLDWLASEFVDRGWSVKAMHRLIMSSDAYRRSSIHPDPRAVAEADPEGTAYAVFAPRRLAAEELRDAMLAASGLLNPAIGGIPVRPELNPEVALQPRQVMGTFATAWEASPLPSQRHRRSLYARKLRGLRDPFFEVFNQPSPETSCERRDASTVTPQVFGLFNGDAILGRALALADRVLLETDSEAGAIDRAFALALGRSPTAVERDACLDHWEAMTERHRTIRLPRQMPPRSVVREAVEENTGVRFTFDEVLESADDYVPDLQPADVVAEVRGLMDVCLVLFNANEFAYLD